MVIEPNPPTKKLKQERPVSSDVDMLADYMPAEERERLISYQPSTCSNKEDEDHQVLFEEESGEDVEFVAGKDKKNPEKLSS